MMEGKALNLENKFSLILSFVILIKRVHIPTVNHKINIINNII